jgi:hypothetical protein
MPYALVEDVAASWESYERFAANLVGHTPDGLILHAAGRTDEGFRIIEVWESEAAWRRFADGAEQSGDGRFSSAPSYLRDIKPTHLVLGRDLS